MDREQLESIFDRQAPEYDQLWSNLGAFRDGLYLLLGPLLSNRPSNSRVLSVGAGTGVEIAYLAREFPGWTFTAVEPSTGMLNACRRRAEEHGYASRCTFHEGYLDTLPDTGPFDAATCFLVSQFLLDKGARSDFFRAIAERLRPGAILASSDLVSDVSSKEYRSLLEVWLRMMAAAEVPTEAIERMREAYGRDVAVLPEREVEAIIVAGGFESPVKFFQAGLIHAWYSQSPSE
jgi:tRNA (cmo5U34)-methyltransferase